MRLTEARRHLEQQQAEAAAALRGPSIARPPAPQQQQQPAPPPLASEPSDGALSMSAPVTLNDKQHRTAAALLGSLGQTAGRGRERLARLERVLNTIAADAAEPQKVRGFVACNWHMHCRPLLQLPAELQSTHHAR